MDELVQLEDVCPTILELTGRTVRQIPVGGWFTKDPDEIPRFSGNSLVPFLREGKVQPPSWREWVYIESHNGIDTHDPPYFARTLRTARYRYTRSPWERESSSSISRTIPTSNTISRHIPTTLASGPGSGNSFWTRSSRRTFPSGVTAA